MKKLLGYLVVCFMTVSMLACTVANPPTAYEARFLINGELYKTVTADQDGNVALPADPTLDEHYYFDGWFLDNDVWQSPFTGNEKISENVYVYAKICRVVYNVNFMSDGELFHSGFTDHNGDLEIPSSPLYDLPYYFDGWYLDEGTWETPFTADTEVTSNLTVYAKISRYTYDVKFTVDGELYQTVSSDQSGRVTLPADPTPDEEFSFDGWFLDEGTWEIPFTADTEITSNLEVYAKLSRKIYNVSFMVNGELYQTVSSDQDGNVALPADPTPDEGYTFDGWFLDEGTWEIPFTADTEITSNLEVYAKTSLISYTVTFNVDGEPYHTVTTDHNGVFNMPEDPELGCGYVFEGWYLDNGVWENQFVQPQVAGDTQIHAKLYKYVIAPTNGGTIDTLDIGSRVWSTNDYVFTSLPKSLLDNPYILWSINGPNKATTLRSGWVYVITGEALTFGTASSQMEKLDGYNFTLLDTSFWNLWSASLKNNYIYEKYVEEGESFELGRWSVVIMSDTQLDIHTGEPIETDDKLAVLKPTGNDSVANMELKAKVFNDRTYTFYDMPYWLAGKNYIQTGYAPNSHSATVTKSGIVYMLTSKAGNISITNALVSAGWTDVTDTIPSDLNLFGDSSQNGAFLNSTYQGFAMLKKSVNEGDTLTWGKWGIPVFSGEFVIADDVARLVSDSDTTNPAIVEEGMRLFSDRTYYAMNGIPTGLEGLTYFMDGITEGATVKAASAGTAYLMIPSGTDAYKTLEQEVVAAGWKLVPHRPVRLAVGLLFGNRMYCKSVEVGEQIHFGKYNLIFGAPADSEDDYYVMPSLTTPADVIVNPEGDLYDINKQSWLGCPTIEKTEGGRVWSGWFTGGERELGTGNYAIINYSDDDCKTWTQAVAIVHPDTAVQVTKPELWTAPNGDLWLFWIQHTGTGNFDGIMGTWASVCENPDDQAPTWSTPKRLTDGYMRSKPIIVDVDGVTTWMYSAFDWMQPHYTRVYASTDDGQTWAFRGKAECLDFSSGKNNLDDPVLVQKPNGTLWLLMRPSTSTKVYESFSTDGGYTWTHAKPSNIEGPQSRFSIDRLDGEKMLMVFHDSTSRNRLTAYLSEDSGETWEYKLLLDERSTFPTPTLLLLPTEIFTLFTTATVRRTGKSG